MDQSYNQLFDEKDLLEENKYQKIYRGCYKDQPHKRVLIQKIVLDDRFTPGFKDFLDSTLQNKLHIEIMDNEIVLVSKYIEGDNISLHLNFSDVTEQERIDYLYDYLHQSVAYIGYDNYLFNVLISSSQIVFKDDQLYLKEQLNLDRRINEDMPFSLVAKNIGQVMQRILITNFTDLKTSLAYDEMHRFTESLIRREKDYQSFDDLFTDFKALYFKKLHTKNQTLVGNAHPNNIFMEFVDVDEVQTEKPTKEVTDEERAFLMGTSYEPVAEPIEEIIEPIQEPIAPEPIDWSKGPIEESIDLSKLEDASSLEDLFVKEDHKVVDKPVIDKVINEEPLEQAVKTEEPVYGVPSHFKDPKLHHELEEEEEEKKPFNFLIPATIFAAILLVVLGFMFIPPLFTSDGDYQLPEASFTLTQEGDNLLCKNTSQAFGGEVIDESVWVVEKNGKEVGSRSVEGTKTFQVSGMSAGVYSIKLTVRDSKGEWSDPFVLEKEIQSSESKALENQIQTQNELASSQSFKSVASSEEQLDEYPVSTTINVTEDDSIFYKGTKSFKINLENGDTFASLSFNPIEIKPGSTISFMIMSNDVSPIKINMIGYNQGNVAFEKNLVSKNSTKLDWTTSSIQMNGEKTVDKLVIRLEAEQAIIWFDELSIRTFK